MAEITYALSANQVYGQLNGRYVDALSTLSVLEDWEDQDLTGYTNNAGGTFNTASPLEGAASIEFTAFGFTWYDGAGSGTITSRGNKYSQLFEIPVDGTSTFAFYGIQDVSTNPQNDSYEIVINDNSRLQIYLYQGGNGTLLSEDTNFNISTGTTYTLEFDYGQTGVSNNLTARVLAPDDTVEAETTATDDTHGAGSYGWYGGGGDDGWMWDYLTEEPL